MRKIILITFALLVFTFSGHAQTDEPQTVTITQETANKLYDLAAKGKGFDAYKTKAEADIAERDKIIEDLKIKLAMETQKSIDLQAETVNQRAIITVLLPMVRAKKVGLINIF